MKEKKVLISHGSGGSATKRLVEEVFLQSFDSNALRVLNDFAVLDALRDRGKLVFSTDCFVVSPLFFKGGDIGKLSVCGTVNDLSMSGATPLVISAGFIIEEGFLISDLRRVAESMKEAALEAGVEIVCADTKVVDRHKADGLFICTSGVGVCEFGDPITGHGARPGDLVIINGPVADHGIAIMSQREGIEFETNVTSDCAPLNGLVRALLEAGVRIDAMRDPTRGGLATILNEIASQSGVGVEIWESEIPVRDEVRFACDMLGLDPLYVANEGKVVLFVCEKDADKALGIMRANKYGKDSKVIGRTLDSDPGKVYLRTSIGTHRVLGLLSGEQLPRIC